MQQQKTIHPLWGLIPLASGLYTAVYHLGLGQWYEGLWLCNVCNVFLGLAIMRRWPRWIWITTIWLLIGTPLWVWDLYVQNDLITLRGLVMHLGAAAVGVLALPTAEKGRRVWWMAVLFQLGLQLLCRLATPASANVNISHRIWEGLEGLFGSFWFYELFNVVSLTAIWLVLELTAEWIINRHSAAKQPAPGQPVPASAPESR